MLHSLHAYAETYATTAAALPGMDILEVNVEDPAPAFVALRDSVDYQRFSSICGSTPSKINDADSVCLREYDVTNKEYFLPVSDERLSSVARALKITKRQAQIVHEMYKLAQAEQWKEQTLLSKDTAKNNNSNTY